MSGRQARQVRRQQQGRRQRRLGLLTGIEAPSGYTLRLAQPGDGATVVRLALLAGVEVEEEFRRAIDEGPAGNLAIRALQDDDLGARALVEHWAADPTQALLASVTAVVATHPDHSGPVGVCLISMPGQVLATAIEGNLTHRQVMLLSLQLHRLRVLAVDPEHRGSGLGTALLQQGARLTNQERHADLYGQIDQPGLADWYAARGFRALPHGHGLNMAWLLDVPLIVFPGLHEQVVIRTFQPRRPLFAEPAPAAPGELHHG